MIIPGIICGLAAAFAQCVSYLFSKKFIHKDGNSFALLAASHLIMGGFAAVCLGILLLENDLPPLKNYWLELLEVNGFYLFGQLSFFLAISKTEASRLAPLLGLKIIFIALMGVVFWGLHLSFWQWLAVILCFTGAAMSNWTGGSIPLTGIWWLLGAVTGYSLSDISIKQLISRIETVTGTGMLPVFTAAAVSYFLLGIFSLLVILVFRPVKLKQLKPALPFSCCWFGAMLFLFTCFALIGPLFGNIVQSSRGIIAVAIGAVIAGFGWSEHERKLPHALLARRIAAAFLITAAIILYAFV
ncbi:MAG: DMT family transporter [Victivallaceae bacterium]|nr:DMT family transporter [Victivallaceae bacterium]